MNNAKEFSRIFLGGPDRHQDPGPHLQRFWASIPDADPRKTAIRDALLQRPDIENEEDLWSRAVPIVIHGDSFPAADYSCMAVSWSGFLAQHLPTKHTKMLLSALLNKCKAEATSAFKNGNKQYYSQFLVLHYFVE